MPTTLRRSVWFRASATGRDASPPPDNSATIALLERWTREDASDDPAAIARAEKELAQLKAAFNANRPPESPVFP
jgi:hypothetical protein